MPYSDKKIKVNPPAEYSTLNPETSSDSPSEKSKGVRLVSATSLRIHNRLKIGQIKISETKELVCFKK